jgi:hypothetical protein
MNRVSPFQPPELQFIVLIPQAFHGPLQQSALLGSVGAAPRRVGDAALAFGGGALRCTQSAARTYLTPFTLIN